jgi:NAD(P)-dependent dehydrogenase (short-subunit alcohol dehydrogenase family)
MARLALVVGGTSGIGHGLALQLASLGHDVTIAGRSVSAGQAIVDEMKAISPNNTYKFEQVDGFDLQNCANFAKSQANNKIDYLFLTLGMATIQGFTPTKDGFDKKLQLHSYSRFLIAQILSPTLARSDDGRVMSVLSGGIHGAYKGYKTDPSLAKGYSIKNAADAAGFYNDCYFDCLAAVNPNVAYSHACPGLVSTKWGTEMPVYLRAVIRPLQMMLGKSKETCAKKLTTNFFAMEKGKMSLVDENGGIGGKGGKAKLTAMHEEAKEDVFLEGVCSQNRIKTGSISFTKEVIKYYIYLPRWALRQRQILLAVLMRGSVLDVAQELGTARINGMRDWEGVVIWGGYVGARKAC